MKKEMSSNYMTKKTGGSMGNLGKVSSKGKEDYSEVPGAKTEKVGFKESNDIFPQEDSKKKNPGLETEMESRKALSSDMVTDGTYAAGKKTGYMDESVWNYKGKKDKFGADDNMWPEGGFEGAKGSNVV